MTVRSEPPTVPEPAIRAAGGGVNARAKEAFLVDLYRQGRIGRAELGRALGLDRFRVDGLLKRHNVVEDPPSTEKLARERAGLDRLMDRR